jgi:hypothetical protein
MPGNVTNNNYSKDSYNNMLESNPYSFTGCGDRNDNNLRRNRSFHGPSSNGRNNMIFGKES